MRSVLWQGRGSILLAIAVITLVGLTWANPHFWTGANLFSVGLVGTEIGIIALGQTLVITAGGIDLSVGAIFALSQVIMGLLMASGVAWPLAVLVGVLVGVGLGGVNGLLTEALGIPSIIVTLATMFAFNGLALVFTGGVDVSGLSSGFFFLGQGTVAGFPLQLVAIYLPLLVLVYFVQRYTHFGRNIYLIGTNPVAAALSGIRLGYTRCMTFVWAGGLSAVAGVVDAARLTTARPDAGATHNLTSIAIVVLGGANIFGGEGTVIGTALATLVIALVDYGLSFNNLNSIYQSGLIGLILLASVLLQNVASRYRLRRSAEAS